MKSIIKNQSLKTLLLLLTAVFLSGGLYAGGEKGAKIKVLSYNIHHCNPPSKAKEGLIDIPAVAKVIKESKADLVALQEVDVNTERSGKGVHEARELARLTGMHFFFVKTIDHQGGDYGIAVLSRFPILDSVSYKLPMKEGAGGEPRGLAVITVKLKGGKKMLFASTHFDLKAANKPLQAEEINRIFRDQSLPVVLAGDFNSVPESDAIVLLDTEFRRSCKENCGFTIPEINPTRTIDYIMFRKPEQVEVLSHRVISEPYASDHLPVMAELMVK